MRELDKLLDEAERHPTAGWDFSWLEGRIETSPLPWDFREIVEREARRSPDLLDMGTGGGEWLASLEYRPARTVATESWPPNVPLAAERLGPLGIEVLQVEPAIDNVRQAEHETSGRLPFADDTFHLIVNRHESFVASERVLAPGGHFLTQQAGDGIYADFCRLLGVDPPDAEPWCLSAAVAQVEAAGLHVTKSGAADQTVTFAELLPLRGEADGLTRVERWADNPASRGALSTCAAAGRASGAVVDREERT